MPDPPEFDEFGLPIRKWVPPVDTPSQVETSLTTAQPEQQTPESSLSPKPELQPEKPKDNAVQAATGHAEVLDHQDDGSREAPSDFQPYTKRPESKFEGKDAQDGALDGANLSQQGDTELAAQPPGGTGNNAKEVEEEGIKVDETSADRLLSAVQPATNSSMPSSETKHTRGESTSSVKKGHVRQASAVSATVGEFSHQQVLTTQLDPKKEEVQDDEDDGWQEMPAYASYDIYDDNNKLVAKEYTVEEEDTEKYGYGNLGGAGKGYTRVVMDDDAESATSMDENTKYLFKEANSTSVLHEEDQERDAVSQMQATKHLLTEGQRVAYVGLTRLEIHQLVKEAETIGQTKGTRKEVATGAEAAKMWGQKMMLRLYTHMDISAAEQVMVEQLSEHGVLPSDLTPLLMANARVKNPMAADRAKSSSASSSVVGKGSSSSTPRPSVGDSPTPQTPPCPEEEKPAEPPPPYEAHPTGEMPEVKMPSQLPSTQNLEIDIRWTILCDLFLLLISDSTYDARSRLLLERVGKRLEIEWLDIRKFEKRVTDALEMQQQAEKENWNEEEHMEQRRKQALKKRYVMMGLATVGGGLVIGLSAGLLAPVIGAGLAAGFTTIGVTGTSTFLGGVGGAAIITSAAASSGSVIGVRAANRRTGAVKTFEYRPLHNNKRVHLIVTVSGWMTGKVDDVRLPFSTVDPILGDLYSVLWEPEMLRSTGDTINILATEALTQGLQQVLGSTILMGLMAALQLPVILTKLSYLIDNPWAVSLDRATAAGLILADSLIDRSLGTRPITLVGYSIGARVIFSCLQELARRGAYGLVQNVYMFGSPVVVKTDEYIKARTVVPGRFVNAYHTNDWILGYLFRLTSGGIRRVAGLAPIEGLPWIENLNVTDLVKGHMDYRRMMPRLLRECGWPVESDEFTEIEDPDPENHEQRQRELINEIEEARKELEREGQKSKKNGRFSLFSRKKRLEKADWEIYDTSQAQGGKTEDQYGNNHGVLFDIDAIRAELAKEEMQVKELQSTLPPMKLDIHSSPASTSSPRDNLGVSPSPEGSSQRPSYDSRVSQEPLRASSSNRASSPYYLEASDPYKEDEISMTFDTSFQDPPPPPPPPPKDDVTPASKPEMRSSQTIPNITMRDPWGDPDDEDFGKEKEISMTFA